MPQALYPLRTMLPEELGRGFGREASLFGRAMADYALPYIFITTKRDVDALLAALRELRH